MDAGGARHLREALHRALDVLAGDHHQVGHLVDDDDDEGKRLELELLLLVDRLAGFLVVAGVDGAGDRLALRLGFGDAHVEAVDVAHADLRHLLVALFHLAHRPLQRDDGLARVGDDRREQMRNAVIDGELEHLGIDHDQPALVRREPVEQAENHGVDRDRLAGAGGAGDQQVRHAREIDNDRLAADGLAEAERQLRLRLGVFVGRQHFAEVDLLALVVRQLDADGVAAGHHRDARRQRAHRAGDVVGEADDARRLDAGRGLQFIERDDRAGTRVDDLAAHAEVLQHAFQRLRALLDRFRARREAVGRLRHRQKRQFGKLIAAVRALGGLGDARPCARARASASSSSSYSSSASFALVERGLDAVALRHHRSRCTARRGLRREQRRAAADQPAEARLEAQQRVDQPAERDRSALGIVVRGACRFARPALVELHAVGIVIAEAGCDDDHRQRAKSEHDRGGDNRGARHRAHEKRRQRQHGIADHAAEPGGQRPVIALRQAGGEARGEHGAGEPERQPHPFAIERTMRRDAPAPHCDGQYEDSGGKPEQLHQEIGADRARRAEQVADRSVGGVAQRGILHRPGRKRHGDHRRERDQREAAAFADAAPEQGAQLVRPVRKLDAAVDGCHVFRSEMSLA